MNVAVVAQANKMARTIWAILAHDRREREAGLTGNHFVQVQRLQDDTSKGCAGNRM
jgi:hypothetical protein